jgi:hypothetical protein
MSHDSMDSHERNDCQLFTQSIEGFHADVVVEDHTMQLITSHDP